MKLYYFPLIVILLTVANMAKAQNYDSEQIVSEIYRDTVERTGKLDYKRTLSLSFKSAGYLALLNIDEGERFEKGQLLASLDITELQENKNANYAQLLQAKRDVKRISQLMDDKMASERDLDTAITQVDTTRAAYQVAYYNLEKARIYAPFSGVVLKRNTELGELQSPGQEALKVARTDDNWIVKVALTGKEISYVYLQQAVQVSLPNMGFVKGVVTKIPAMSDNGNLFTIEVSLPDLATKSGVIAGQLAGVTIAFETNTFVYKMPIQALVSVNDNGEAMVVTKSTSEADFKLSSFEIFQLDNNYIYVKHRNSQDSINVMTKGWQNYLSSEQ